MKSSKTRRLIDRLGQQQWDLVQKVEVLAGIADTFKVPPVRLRDDVGSSANNAQWFPGETQPAYWAYGVFVGAAILLAWTTSWTTRGLQEAMPATDAPQFLRLRHPEWLVMADPCGPAEPEPSMKSTCSQQKRRRLVQPSVTPLFWTG